MILNMEITPMGLTSASVSPAGLTANALAFVEACKSRKGQFIKLDYKSNPAPKAEFKGTTLEKVTSGIFRTGVDFSNLTAVKEAIENKERGEVQSLPLGQTWAVFPFVIKTAKGGELLRITVAKGQYPSVIYKVDGVEVSKENFESYLTKSKQSDPTRDPLLVFTIKSENLISVAGTELTE
jgi:hypothetical protein